MKLMRNRFQKGVTALIVGWLALFVLLPNLMKSWIAPAWKRRATSAPAKRRPFSALFCR